MERTQAFERQLAAELQDMVGAPAHYDSLAVARTAKATKLGWSLPQPRLALSFVAAAVVLLVATGAVALSLLGTRQTDDALMVGASPSPEAVLAIPSELPESVEGGTIETPAGSYRWIRLDHSDERPLPTREAWALGGPLGLVVRTDGSSFGRSSGYALTTDGIAWEPWDPGVDRGDRARSRGEALARAGGYYWLFRGDELWRSADGVEWRSLTPGGIVPPWPAGLSWRVGHESTQTASLGDTTVIQLHADGNFPERELELGACNEKPVATGRAGVYRWKHDENCPGGGPVRRFEESGTGLRVFDDTTGEELTFIEGLTMEHIDSMTRTNELGLSTLLVIQGDEISYLDIPWGDGAYSLHALGDAFVANPQEDHDRPVLRSEDGLEWASLGPSDLASEGFDAGPFINQGSHVPSARAETPGDDASSEPTGAWDTVDGLTWQGPPEGQPDGTMAMRLDSGWFATEHSDFYGPTPSGLLWMHAGDEWVSLADLGTACPDLEAWRPLDATAAGATTLVLGHGRCGAFLDSQDGTLWIIQPESPT